MIQQTQVSTGITGANRKSWRAANPRFVLKSIIDENPHATIDEIRDLCWEYMTRGITFSGRYGSQSMAYLDAIFEHWFANDYKSLHRERQRSGAASAGAIKREETRRRQEAHETELRERIERHIEKKVTIRLLEMTMPTGKKLGDSTREELIDLGGWAARVAVRLGPAQTVLQAGLTEEQLRELYESP